MMEVDVPAAVQPNQLFTVQTPSGNFVQLKAPPAGEMAIGQRRMRFQVPDGAGALPTLLGAEEGAAGIPVVGASALGHSYSQPVVQGVPVTSVVQGYRVDPRDATLSNVPLLQGIPEEKAERKLSEIRRGSDLMQANPPFPERRTWRDVFWILPFLAVLGVMLAGTVAYSMELEKDVDESVEVGLKLKDVWIPAVVGSAASIVAAYGYFMLMQYAAGCVVYTSLVVSQALLILLGFALLVNGSAFAGVIFIGVGVMQLFCIFTCWKDLIPFMIKLVEIIGKVVRQHTCGLFVVAIVGAILGLAWSIMCGITFFGIYQQYGKQLENSQYEQYGVLFLGALVYVWGAQVVYAVCHLTYCGVFGRWYFAKTGGVMQSLRVALTYSFGSISFGSFLIAAVRAAEFVASMARSQAQEEGNTLCCIVFLIVEMVIGCIGDMLEYFSEWAYVQCAVRGVKFTDAARITYSLCTCANIDYILRDLLLNSLISTGAILCGIVGGAVGAGTGFAVKAALANNNDAVILGAVIGALAGLMAGGSAAGIIGSGTKTIMVLWAEDPEPLRLAHPETHQEFEARIAAKIEAQ